MTGQLTSAKSRAMLAPLPIPAQREEYVYVCFSEQMDSGLFKVGETHRQSPAQRARQFTGVDRKVTWAVVRAFPTPNSRHTEKLVHARLKRLGAQQAGHREIFKVDLATVVAIIEECVRLTPERPLHRIEVSASVAVPLEDGPWRAALSMPLTHQYDRDMTLARAMAMAARGDHLLEKKLYALGLQLVYPDDDAPHYMVHCLPGAKWAMWLMTQDIAWSALGLQCAGDKRKIRCEIFDGHQSS